MNTILSIEAIKQRDKELYNKVLQRNTGSEKEMTRGKGVVKNANIKNNEVIKEINQLIDDIVRFSAIAISFDDYHWLSNTVSKWQSVLSTTFGEPRATVTLLEPKTSWQTLGLPSGPSSVFSEEEIKNWSSVYEEYSRYAHIVMRLQDSSFNNKHMANVSFANEILEGKKNFVQRISPVSYHRLEWIWLEEVKRLKAFFIWLSRGDMFGDKVKKDYSEAGSYLRNMLVDNGIKAQSKEFSVVKDYIKEHYLGSDGHISSILEEKSKLYALIQKKAYHIFETTGSSDTGKNWIHAGTYVKMFYENIIPAIEDNNKEKVLRVLKAFQFSKMNSFLIINCFEIALAIYFIDAGIIQSLWDESKGKGDTYSNVESIVYVDSWPQNFEVTEACRSRFWFDATRIGFKGVMLDVEKKALEKALKAATSGKPLENHINAIKKLYEQSRLIQKDTTL